MGQHDANKAEVGFFNALLSDGPLEKEAAIGLEPETEKILGVQTVSPSVLEGLEEEAKNQAPEQAAQTEVEDQDVEFEQAPEVEGREILEEREPPQPEESLDVGSAPPKDEEPPQEETPAPELPSRATHGKLFTDRRAHPLQIFDILTMRYRGDWPDWEPDTLWWALRRDFGPVGEIVRNKVQALGLAAITDVPWLDWDVFENCGQAWNDFVPIFGAFQPMSPMQVAFTVQVLRGVRFDEEFSHEVNAYMAAVLDEYGWVYAPEEWFVGAQEILDRKDWMVGFKSDVASAWKQVQDVPPEDVDWEQNDPLGVHLLKLAVVKRYLEGREELRRQVPGVLSRVTGAVTASPPVP